MKTVFIMAVLALCVMCYSCGPDVSVSGSVDGHDYVDLGLPSGILWATCNVGASTPEGSGSQYAWGETEPKESYKWENYRYKEGEVYRDFTLIYVRLIKYCNNSSYGNNGYTDNLTTLEADDDAATANWGSGWRMPTKAEFEELMNKCSWKWSDYGYKVIGPNGNSIFLPAEGYRYDSDLGRKADYAPYWSSSLDSEFPSSAMMFGIGKGGYFHKGYYMNYLDRSCGLAVRPVCSGKSSGGTSSVQAKEQKPRKSEKELKQEAEDFVLECYKKSYEYYKGSEINYSADLERARKNWKNISADDCDRAEDIFYDREYDDGCGSWCDQTNRKYNVEDVTLVNDNTIKVCVRYSYSVYSAYDDQEFIANVKHKDEFTIIKENGDWVIDDLVRDGVSSKDAYRRNDKKFGRDKC
ncbi:MAG: hypothetical protein IK025_05775 [Bacteroidales bacterium]|nr:hypothetical protein [Bacteroidales bacterium]